MFALENKNASTTDIQKNIGHQIVSVFQNQSKVGLSHYDNQTGIIRIFHIFEYIEGTFDKTVSFLTELKFSTLLMPKNISLLLKNLIEGSCLIKHANVISIKPMSFDVEGCEKIIMQLSLQK